MKRFCRLVVFLFAIALASWPAIAQQHDFGPNCASSTRGVDLVLVANANTSISSVTLAYNPHDVGLAFVLCAGSLTDNNTTAGAATSTLSGTNGTVAQVFFSSKNSIPATSFADEQFMLVDSFVGSQSPLTETAVINDTAADTIKAGSGMWCCTFPTM